MLEQEIKLHVPADARKAVAAQMGTLSGPRRVRLRAMYFDTANRHLARQHAAIRLRQEGRRWVQTFKMAGDDAVSRIELNHPRPGPELDLGVYEGTPAQAVIAKIKGELTVRYETDVMRLARQVSCRKGVVELAYDVGVIRAGTLEVPVNELEFECVSGDVSAVFSLAARWLRQHALILDARSKAERGDALARAAAQIARAPLEEQASVREAEIVQYWAPANADNVRLERNIAPSRALAVLSGSCYDQIVRNAAMLAEVDTAHLGVHAGPEHVHQLRVGLRRLRSAWQLFRGWVPAPGVELQEGARYYFGEFGSARDADVLNDTVVPQLTRAGMPPVSIPAGEAADAAAVARSPVFQVWLLDLLAFTAGLDAEDRVAPEEEPDLKRAVTKRLRKWHQRILADGKHFSRLEDAAKHELRKLGKRLRYGLTLTESLYSGPHLKSYKKSLSALQDVLGEINDLAVARERYAELVQSEPHAWFAVGWTSARLHSLDAQAEAAIAALADTRPFWR